jgi:transglutaminase/protease-like cytokinesis protein 3
LRYARKKQVPPDEIIKFFKENGIERSCKEFRKLRAQAQLEVAEDREACAETSLEEVDTENKVATTSVRGQALKDDKKVTGKAGDQASIETTSDFDRTYTRITRNRKDILVTIDGYVSADGRLSLRNVRITDASTTRKPRPKTW